MNLTRKQKKCQKQNQNARKQNARTLENKTYKERLKELCFCSVLMEYKRNALQPFTHILLQLSRDLHDTPLKHFCVFHTESHSNIMTQPPKQHFNNLSQNKQALFAILLVQTPLLLSWNIPTSGQRTPGLPVYIKSNREWSFDPTGISINSTRVRQRRLKVPK